jgi:hypothetical protein
LSWWPGKHRRRPTKNGFQCKHIGHVGQRKLDWTFRTNGSHRPGIDPRIGIPIDPGICGILGKSFPSILGWIPEAGMTSARRFACPFGAPSRCSLTTRSISLLLLLCETNTNLGDGISQSAFSATSAIFYIQDLIWRIFRCHSNKIGHKAPNSKDFTELYPEL